MEQEIDLRQYVAVVWRWWWLIVACTLLAAVAAFAVSSTMAPVYSASATLLVRQSTTEGMNDYNALLMSEKLSRTYSEMLTSRSVLKTVVDQLELEGTWKDLSDRVSVESARDTLLIEVSAEDESPTRAAEIADAVADAFIAQNQTLQEGRYAESLSGMQAQMNELSTQMEETQTRIDDLDDPETPQEQAELTRLETVLAGYRNTYASLVRDYEQARLAASQATDDVIVFERAQVPENPVRPRRVMNTGLAGVVGGMLAVGAIFLIEYLDDTYKSPEDIQRELSLGTLGTIGKLDGAGPLVTLNEPLSPVSEAYRVLRTNIRFAGVDKPIRKLLVTSAVPTEGKTTTAANLAIAMAQAGLEVVLVDADLRRPKVHEVFQFHPRGGVTGSLLEGSMNGNLQSTQVETLSVLPSGEVPPNPSELVGSQRMEELLDELAEQADVVVIDSPPTLAVTDAAVLARHVDGVLLVVNAGETRREPVRRALTSLEQVKAHVIGVVLNRVGGRGEGYYYHEYYSEDGEKQRKGRRRTKAEGA